jgi:plastocyanin
MTAIVHSAGRHLAWIALHLGLLALPAVVGWQTPAKAVGLKTIVSIRNFAFSPAELTIAPGTTVTWINQDDIAHTVMEANKAFWSRAMDTDDKFSFTFNMEGEFAYFCSLHPRMTGKIVVKAGAS